jgi:hypothetical protein
MLVVDIRRPQIENLVAAGKRSPLLSAAPNFHYDQTRLWAQQLPDHLPEMRGILYESHQVRGDCIIVFAEEGMTVFEPVHDAISVRDEPVRPIAPRGGASECGCGLRRSGGAVRGLRIG